MQNYYVGNRTAEARAGCIRRSLAWSRNIAVTKKSVQTVLIGQKGDVEMKTIRTKRIWLGAMLAILMVTSASASLSGCLVCRDCGPNRQFRHK